MAKYRAGDEVARRKHRWLPCAIAAKADEMSDEEFVRALRATWWADNITNAEWPVVLGQEGASKSTKSRLKRKLVGWFMAQGRIAALNPELWHQAYQEAQALYAEQVGEPHPVLTSSPPE
jgi:hypothetical protein